MKHRRELIVTNVLALLVLVIALIAGWRDAAAFGLAVLVMMDLMIVVRTRSPRPEEDSEP